MLVLAVAQSAKPTFFLYGPDVYELSFTLIKWLQVIRKGY